MSTTARRYAAALHNCGCSVDSLRQTAQYLMDSAPLWEALCSPAVQAKEKKAVLNRLSRAIGHLESVKKMVENGRDCSEVLIQIAAVRSAINNIGKVILQDHIQHCIVDAVEQDDAQALDDLCQAIDKFIQ